jgi:tetraacyldisaccharide 4'-kinase
MEVPAARGVAAFCAIARPEEFFSGLRNQGVQIAAMRAWRDHHRYLDADVAELLELRRQHEAEAFLTTEKDRARLTPGAMHMLEGAAPVLTVRLTVRLQQEAAVMEQLCRLVARAGDGLAGRGALPGA